MRRSLTLALTSDTLALAKVEDLADTILAQKISQLVGGRAGLGERRTEASRSHPGEPRGAGGLWAFA